MLRFILFIFGIALLCLGISVFSSAEKTFEAKFKNIDGLPKGAPVTALGVKIGEVVKTRTIKDGIIVNVKITNTTFPKPEAGSQLAITSFRPNQGRVIEIISPDKIADENKAWIIKEPITTESWFYASLDILDGIKQFSESAIKVVTPENFNKARTTISMISGSVQETANRFAEHEGDLISLKRKLEVKASEANTLLVRLKEPINKLNELIYIDGNVGETKKDLRDFTGLVASISTNVSDNDFVTMIKSFKMNILNHLNEVNDSLIEQDTDVIKSTLPKKLQAVNKNLESLNNKVGSINSKDLKPKTLKSLEKAKSIISDLEEKTSKMKN